MPFESVKINFPKLTQKVNRGLDLPSVKMEVLKRLTPSFNKAKRRMLKRFYQHNVTQEILDGPTAENISQTLNGVDGNLFSFIGFHEGTDPIAPIANLLENIKLKQTYRRDNVIYFRVDLPTHEEILEESRMEWDAGESWVEGIERGIAGLNYYIYTHWDAGRSKEGVQLNGKVSKQDWEYVEGATFNTTPYLTEILNQFREEVDNLK